MRKAIVLIAMALLCGALSAYAQNDYVIDPGDDPPIFVSSPGCPSGTCFVYGSEVVGIHGNTVTMVNQGGSSNIVGTMLVIVGVPTGQPAPGTGTASQGQVWQGNTSSGGVQPIYGWSGQFNNGSFTDPGHAFGTSSRDVYKDILKLNPPTSGNSESLGNWQNADKAALNLTVNGFTIYVYTVTNVNIGTSAGHNSINITFSGNIPQGSFIVGYGCSSTVQVQLSPSTPSQQYCGYMGKDGKPHISPGSTYATPFTHAALELDKQQPPVPEPGTLSLLGTGLFAAAALFRRRLQG